jgi:hypothetical protein
MYWLDAVLYFAFGYLIASFAVEYYRECIRKKKDD